MLYYVVQFLWAPCVAPCLVSRDSSMHAFLYCILLNCWLTMRSERMPWTSYTEEADSQRTGSLLHRVVNSGHYWGPPFLTSHCSLVRLARRARIVPSNVCVMFSDKTRIVLCRFFISLESSKVNFIVSKELVHFTLMDWKHNHVHNANPMALMIHWTFEMTWLCNKF